MLRQNYDYVAHVAAVTGLSRGAAGAAWRCDMCQVWWGTQNSPKPTTKFLLQLPSTLTEQLGWDEYRGWKMTVAEAGVCPECGQPSGRIVYAAA
jgi:rubrerythrin